jgi:hypothetical protein
MAASVPLLFSCVGVAGQMLFDGGVGGGGGGGGA